MDNSTIMTSAFAKIMTTPVFCVVSVKRVRSHTRELHRSDHHVTRTTTCTLGHNALARHMHCTDNQTRSQKEASGWGVCHRHRCTELSPLWRWQRGGITPGSFEILCINY